jgi:DNA (cytosine-5)-methyltransferase 1
LGYNTVSSILEASDFGLSQRRQRTIVIGWKKGLNLVSLTAPTHSRNSDLFGSLNKITVWEAISDLPVILANDSSDRYAVEPQNENQKTIRNGCTTLTENNSTNYGKKMLEILSLVPYGGSVSTPPDPLINPFMTYLYTI